MDESERKNLVKNKKHKWKFNWVFDLNTLIALFALCFGIVALYINFSQQTQINTINYQRMAEDYRPRLIASNPFNLSVKLKVDTLTLLSSLKTYSIKDRPTDIVIPLSELKFKFSLWLFNKGNSQANLLAHLMTDSVYWGLLLETKINENFNPKITKVDIDTAFVTIDENDSLKIDIEYIVKNILRNKIIIHLYFLYENENNILYSSYTWIEFKTNPSRLAIKNPDSTKIIGIHNELQLNKNDITYLSIHTFPSIVESNDTATFRNFIRMGYNSSVRTNKLIPDVPQWLRKN